MDEHGISRGTTSDAINVFRKFALPDHSDIAEEWKPWKWSVLIMLKQFDDPVQVVFDLGIDPETTRAVVKARIDEYNRALESSSDPEVIEESSTVEPETESTLVNGVSSDDPEAIGSPIVFALPADPTESDYSLVYAQIEKIIIEEPYQDIVIRRVTR